MNPFHATPSPLVVKPDEFIQLTLSKLYLIVFVASVPTATHMEPFHATSFP